MTSDKSLFIDRLDHCVLTVTDVERAKKFYVDLMRFKYQTNKAGRVSLLFGRQKINLHQAGSEIKPHAQTPTPGAGDLCFVTVNEIEGVKEYVESKGVRVIEGPVQREGALGLMMSIYFRDPDGNLIEISRYSEE